MAITRPFAYNPTQNPISGTEPYGTLVVGVDNLDYSKDYGGLKWWMGPDEELGYIIGGVVSGGTQPSPIGGIGTVGFWRTEGLSSSQFISIANQITGQNFTTADEAKTWLDANNYYASYVDPIALGYYFGGGFATSGGQTYSGMIAFLNTGYQDTSVSLSTGFNYSVECVTVDSNDRILAGGFFTSYNGNLSGKLIRLNSNGSFDNTFNVGSVGFTGVDSTYVYDILVLSDDKVIVVGEFSSYNGTSANRIIKLNTDGSIDNTFTYGAGFNDSVTYIEKLSSGKYIVCGDFTSYNSVSANKIAILNEDGSRYTSFSTGLFNDSTNFAIEQADGKIIVGGGFTTYSGLSYNGIVRLNPNGSIDSTFVVGDGFGSGSPNSAKIQSNGKIIIVGSFLTYQGVTVNRIIRLNSDGSIDNTFDGGEGFDLTVYDVKILPDGKYYVGGSFRNYNLQKAYSFLRLNSDGSIDTTFNRDKNFSQTVNDIAIRSDNTVILTGGNLYAYIVGGYVKFGYDGEINTTYCSNPTVNSSVKVILKSSDGKIYYGGDFTRYGTTVTNRIFRVNSDGTRDDTFVIGTGFGAGVYTLLEDSNNKIVAGGGFFSYQGNTLAATICRLNTDGSIDTTFNPGTGGNNNVFRIIQDSNGKYVVTGSFTVYNNTLVNRIIRLNYDGSLDNSFAMGTGFNSVGYSVIQSSDGKYVVTGGFTTYKGVNANRIIRLNSDGSRDTSFVIGTGFNQQVWSVVEQSDGKLVVGGIFTQYNGTTCGGIVRLNTNGSIDNTFITGTGLNSGGNVYDMKVTSEDKILIGGNFTSYNGSPVNRCLLLNSDGTIDTGFNSLGVDNLVYAVELD